MKISADKIERLVFIKYLLKQAENSKKLDRPLSSSTILTLHDSVECFLQLSFEQLTGKAKLSGHQILDSYTDSINQVLADKGKLQINKAFIKRINELRNQLKHASIFIDSKNIQNLFSETELFFVDFINLIFDLNFYELSLTSLVSNLDIQSYLRIAEKEIESGNYQKAMINIGKAFYELENLETKITDEYGQNILSKHATVDYLIKYRASLSGNEPDKALKENLKEIAQHINRLQDDLYDLKKVISLSVDLRMYKRFKYIIPHVLKIIEGGTRTVKFWVPDEERKNKKEYTIEEVRFCFDLVVFSSLCK